MKKKKRPVVLLVLLAVLILLAVGYFVLAKLDFNGENEKDTKDAGEVVLNISTDDVRAISYTDSEHTTYSFTKTDGTWTYDADQQFPVNQSALKTFVSALTLVKASGTVHQPEALSTYGLDPAVYTYTVTDGDGVHTVMVGTLNSYNSNTYLKIDNSDTIYMFEDKISHSYFTKKLTDWLQTETLPGLISAENMISVRLVRPDATEQTLKVSDTLSSIYNLYNGLKNTDYYAYYNDEDNLAAAGFGENNEKLYLTYKQEVNVEGEDGTASTMEQEKTVVLTFGGLVGDSENVTRRAYRITNASGEELNFIYQMDQTTYDSLMAFFS